jgi:hypothetical protein
VGDDSHFVFRQKLLGERRRCETGRCHGEAARSVLTKVWATFSHVYTQSPQNVAVEPGINSLAFRTGASRCIDRGTSPEYLGYHLLCSCTWCLDDRVRAVSQPHTPLEGS